jgi:hypothetical protein
MPSSHRAHAEWTPSRILQWAHSIGPETGLVVDKIIASKPHPEQGFRSALGVIQLAKTHGSARLEKASRKALLVGSPSYKTLKMMLANRMEEVSMQIAPPGAPIPNNDELLVRQTDLLASENIRGKGYYH